MSNNSFYYKKILVLDTSALIASPDLIKTVEDSSVLIPIEVLEELDKIKNYRDHVGQTARVINRILDSFRKIGSLYNGVENEFGSKIFVVTNADTSILPGALCDTIDHRIISVAKMSAQVFDDVTLVSEDIALRVKCDALNVNCCCVKELNLPSSAGYSGASTIEVEQSVIDTLYQDGEIDPKEFGFNGHYYPNEFIVLKCGQSSAITMNGKDGVWRKLQLTNNSKKSKIQNIRPRNKEQLMSMELLLDPKVQMVTLTGMAGGGKTLLSIAAALEEKQAGNYNKIVISRPAESTSKEIGFLPGDKKEKMLPWLQPIMDNLKVILGERGEAYAQMMIDKGDIEIEALSYIRGRTFQNTILIVDEAQNISIAEAKALITRIGENSKIVLLGDLDQIDSMIINQKNSGLGVVVEKFKEFEGSGHVTLAKGERSALASFAAKVM